MGDLIIVEPGRGLQGSSGICEVVERRPVLMDLFCEDHCRKEGCVVVCIQCCVC